MQMALDNYWYHKNAVAISLLPLSGLFRVITGLRKLFYRIGLLKSVSLPVPVIIVGNINVGGTGKTPLVIHLSNLLYRQGYQPGVITRGYGGKQSTRPQLVTAGSDAYDVSDEAVLLATRCPCPVVISTDRVSSSQLLLNHGCNIIISDDGLQHYRLQRDIEIAVVDGERGFGNGYLMPAGPLRETTERLESVDFIVTNGESHRYSSTRSFLMRLKAHSFKSLHNTDEKNASDFLGKEVHAIAAIGNPRRFFDLLRQLGLIIKEHSFTDHYRYSTSDIEFDDDLPVIMTEKDAVKCRQIVKAEKYWHLPIEADLEDEFNQKLLNKLNDLDK